MSSRSTSFARGVLAFGLALVMLLSVALGSADAAAIGVRLNGVLMSFPDQRPVIASGRTLVPVRFVSEALGAAVEWVDATRTVVVRHGSSVIEMGVGRSEIRVNGEARRIDVPAMLLGGRTMVPLRFVSENLGATVEWIEAERMVVITSRVAGVPVPPVVPPVVPVVDPLRYIAFDRAVHINPDGTMVREKAIEFAVRELDNLLFYRENGRFFLRYNFVPKPSGIRVEVASVQVISFDMGSSLSMSTTSRFPEQRMPVDANWVREVPNLRGVDRVDWIRVVVAVWGSDAGGATGATGRLMLSINPTRPDASRNKVDWINLDNRGFSIDYPIERVFQWR